MAQRFGGRFSPDAKGRPAPGAPAPHPFDGKRPTRAGFRSKVLFVLPFVFAWQAFTGTPAALFLGLGTFALMLLGAWLTREGIFAQEAYDARTVARRPALPRKALGAALFGAGLATGAIMGQQSPVVAAFLGALGAALNLMAFGADPMRDKGTEGIDAFQTNRVATAVDEAERHLAAMRDAGARAGDRAIAARIDRFIATARALFRTVEADPRDLSAARKYLGVYLMGARDATAKFADHYARSRDAQVRAEYEALLDDLETHFAERTRRLVTDGRSDLDVEIAVLRERLAREG
jgi:hypothetical protein